MQILLRLEQVEVTLAHLGEARAAAEDRHSKTHPDHGGRVAVVSRPAEELIAHLIVLKVERERERWEVLILLRPLLQLCHPLPLLQLPVGDMPNRLKGGGGHHCDLLLSHKAEVQRQNRYRLCHLKAHLELEQVFLHLESALYR